MPEGSTPIDNVSDPLQAALRDVLRTCDADRLARQLGLRSAAAAEALRANGAALDHLVLRLAEGCDGLSAEDAAASAARLLEPATEAPGRVHGPSLLGGSGDA